MFRRLAAGFTIAFTASVAAADPGPTLLTVFPPGVKAGETVEVTFSGTGFDGNEQLLFSDSRIKGELVPGSTTAPKAPNPQPGARAASAVKFKVTTPKETPLGMSDVRVVCKGGLSNPRAFVVGEMKDVTEVEPNNDSAQAQKVELETTVNGTIATNIDVDYFSVKVKAGQNVVVYCLATSIDSKLLAEMLVIAPDGKPIASNRGYRDGDAVLDFKAPTDGDYLIRVSQFAYTTGGADHFYRLTITTNEWVDAVFPPIDFPSGKGNWKVVGRNVGDSRATPSTLANNVLTGSTRSDRLTATRNVFPSAGMIDAFTMSHRPDGNLFLRSTADVFLDNEKNHVPDTAQPIKLPCDVAGRIEKKGARHWYAFDAKKGDVWTLEVFADRIGSPVDAFFILTDEKGKVIVEQDDGPDTLSPNQFYTKSDDPGRYRFNVPNDGKYKVMVSTREAAIQFGVRDQYVLRIAKEKPDFRLAVIPVATHYLDAGTMSKGGSVVFNVYAWRFDGFDGPIALSAVNLPKGATCPRQVIGAGQTRGTLVLSAASDAADWAGFVAINGTATIDGGKLESAARPFSIVWPFPGVNAGQQAPNSPMITRMDRGNGLAVAIRGEAPFALAPVVKDAIKVKPGEKIELTVKLTRSKDFKDAVQVYSASANFGPRPQGGQPAAAIGGIAADKDEVKLSLDVPPNLPPGPHTLVLRGVAGATAPKPGGQGQRIPMSYPTLPIAIEVEGKTVPKKK